MSVYSYIFIRWPPQRVIPCSRNAFSPPPVLALCKGTIYSNASSRVESLPSCSRIVQIFFPVYILRLIILVYNDAFTPVCVDERGARNNQDLYLLCAPTKENIYLVEDNPKITGSWVWICGILMLVWGPPPLAFFMGCDCALVQAPTYGTYILYLNPIDGLCTISKPHHTLPFTTYRVRTIN